MIANLVSLLMTFLVPIPSGLGWQADNVVFVAFVSNPAEVCANLHRVPINDGVVGCVDNIGGKRMVLPNPCLMKHEHYARLACHELGHTNGWRHEYR